MELSLRLHVAQLSGATACIHLQHANGAMQRHDQTCGVQGHLRSESQANGGGVRSPRRQTADVVNKASRCPEIGNK
jgi:hypothetical protein